MWIIQSSPGRAHESKNGVEKEHNKSTSSIFYRGAVADLSFTTRGQQCSIFTKKDSQHHPGCVPMLRTGTMFTLENTMKENKSRQKLYPISSSFNLFTSKHQPHYICLSTGRKESSSNKHKGNIQPRWKHRHRPFWADFKTKKKKILECHGCVKQTIWESVVYHVSFLTPVS